MISKPCFTALSSCIKNGIRINIEKVIITSPRVHCDHSMFTFVCRNDFASIFEYKSIRLKISQSTQSKTPITSLHHITTGKCREYVEYFESTRSSFVICVSNCSLLKSTIGTICRISKSAILIIAFVKHCSVETCFVAFYKT